MADARAVLAADEAQLLGGVRDAEQVTFLGRGWSVGLAEEAALKLRESAQLWTEAYPAMEYRHGPISIAAPGRVTWAFGPVPEGLTQEVRATGAHFEHRDVDPMAELVRVHRLCLALAQARGLDPDHPVSYTHLDVYKRQDVAGDRVESGDEGVRREGDRHEHPDGDHRGHHQLVVAEEVDRCRDQMQAAQQVVDHPVVVVVEQHEQPGLSLIHI